MSTVDEQSPSSEIVAGGVTRGMLTGLFASAPPCRCGCSLNDHHYRTCTFRVQDATARIIGSVAKRPTCSFSRRRFLPQLLDIRSVLGHS